MQSQLEWDEKKCTNFERKKGESKEQKKQFLKHGFPNNIEKWRGVLTI